MLKNKLYLIGLSLFVAVVFWSTTALAAPTMFLERHGDAPTPGTLELTVTPGQSFSLDVYLQISEEDYSGTDGVYSGMYWVKFDNPDVMDITGATLNTDLWDPAWSSLNIHPGVGLEAIVMDYFDYSQPWGDLLWEAVDFVAGTDLGVSHLTIVQWSEEVEGEFTLWPDYLPFDNDIEFLGATVNVVPIPGAAFLLISGLIGLIGLGRKKIRG